MVFQHSFSSVSTSNLKVMLIITHLCGLKSRQMHRLSVATKKPQPPSPLSSMKDLSLLSILDIPHNSVFCPVLSFSRGQVKTAAFFFLNIIIIIQNNLKMPGSTWRLSVSDDKILIKNNLYFKHFTLLRFSQPVQKLYVSGWIFFRGCSGVVNLVWDFDPFLSFYIWETDSSLKAAAFFTFSWRIFLGVSVAVAD